MKRMAQLLAVALACTSGARAQGDALAEAMRAYRAGTLAEARTFVDEAVRKTAHHKDPEAWLLRGFIYKDIYKAAGPAVADTLRAEALSSLHKSLALDAEGAFKESAMQACDYLCRSYFTDAAKALADQDDHRALRMFTAHRSCIMRLDPKAELRDREVEFTNALGTLYTKRHTRDRTDTASFRKAVSAYGRVLELEPGNYGANYNLSTLYYNRGVFNIQGIRADDGIPSIMQIQEVSREFFLQALPYMLKAHDMNPSRRETLLGLEGIYYSLQDEESSDKFRRLFEQMPLDEQR